MLGCAVAVLGALLVLPGKAATLAWLRQWPLWQQLQEDLGLATQDVLGFRRPRACDWQTIQVGATTFRYHLQGEMAWPLLLTLSQLKVPEVHLRVLQIQFQGGLDENQLLQFLDKTDLRPSFFAAKQSIPDHFLAALRSRSIKPWYCQDTSSPTLSERAVLYELLSAD
ncbi:unnamed protein product [Durusdinium trenchii]|uniref:Uncharacterized protein n=2 Tax=Durusdinium trenchii TaxID=1381693 RepID=A0ABP0K1T3_9DINO